MICADLGSLLEAHLERRLGRSEIDALRRHLLTCRRCRRKVHELRRFELEVAERVPQLAAAECWSVLEVEPAALLMRPATAGLPPPGRVRVPVALARSRPSGALPTPPRARRRPLRSARLLTRALGMALLALAGLGLVHQLDRAPWSAGEREIAPDAEADRLDLETPDPERLRAWLAAELGSAPPLPPVPADWRLVGGRIEGAGTAAEPVVIYRGGAERRIAVRILKDLAPGRRGPSDGLVLERDGYAYVIEGPLAPQERAVLSASALP